MGSPLGEITTGATAATGYHSVFTLSPWTQTTCLQGNPRLKTAGLDYYVGFSTVLAGEIRRVLRMLGRMDCTSTKPSRAFSSCDGHLDVHHWDGAPPGHGPGDRDTGERPSLLLFLMELESRSDNR